MTKRINMTIDEVVYRKVKKRAGKLGVSGWLTEAAREKINREDREKAWEELMAAPPAFPNIADGAAYIRKLREDDEVRNDRLGI